MIDIDSLKTELEEGIVLIEFQSLNSNRHYDREYTLCQKYMPIKNHISKQSGDRLIVWDVEFRKWEDLKLDTIIDWKVVE